MLIFFLKDKNYILSTSITEGHPNNILEAMACGVKPLIHNYPHSRTQFKDSDIWDSVGDAMTNIFFGSYNSREYRNFVNTNYNYIDIYNKLFSIII